MTNAKRSGMTEYPSKLSMAICLASVLPASTAAGASAPRDASERASAPSIQGRHNDRSDDGAPAAETRVGERGASFLQPGGAAFTGADETSFGGPEFVAGVSVVGDWDLDGDVDRVDYVQLRLCLDSSGPGVFPPEACSAFWASGFPYIDLTSVWAFQRQFTGTMATCGNGRRRGPGAM